MTDRFSRMPVWIARHRLTPNEYRTLTGICSFVDPQGLCWPSLDKLAEITGLPRKKLPAFTKGLVKKGVISIVRSHGKSSNRYTVHYEEPATRNGLGASPEAGQIGRDSVPAAGAQTDQESNQPIEQTKGRREPAVVLEGPNAAVQMEAIEQWNEFARANGLKLVTSLNPKICARLQVCLAKNGVLVGWEACLREIARSPFLLGQRTTFTVTFEWLIKPDNFSKVARGRYRQFKAPEGPASIHSILMRSLRARSEN
jgi:hypothetical protein